MQKLKGLRDARAAPEQQACHVPQRSLLGLSTEAGFSASRSRWEPVVVPMGMISPTANPHQTWPLETPPWARREKRKRTSAPPSSFTSRQGGKRSAPAMAARLGVLKQVSGRSYSSSGSSLSSASENTGPSTHTYLGPTLQRPQMPMPHFMRFSRVV